MSFLFRNRVNPGFEDLALVLEGFKNIAVPNFADIIALVMENLFVCWPLRVVNQNYRLSIICLEHFENKSIP